MSKQIFDEGIPAEAPGEYCEDCGQELKTLKQKAEGLCNECLKATGGITGGKR